MEQELNFLKYRLEIARELPEGPYKTAVLRAIETRIQVIVDLTRRRH
jgi:hypothetical protein